MLDGSHSVFALLRPTDEISERLARQDIHPTGPLWGQGQSLAQSDTLALERAVLTPYERWCRSLEQQGLDLSRRALRVAVRCLRYEL